MTDRRGRIAASLDSVHEAVRMARRELSGGDEDTARWRWVSVVLVIALQGALVAALSGYETAADADVVDPSNTERYAPVTLLLRRARSTDYLNTPERVEMTGSTLNQIERLIAYRNAVVHGLGAGDAEGVAKGCRKLLGVVRHLVLLHPAFDASPHHLVCTLISDEVSGIERLLADRC
ncbi:hypothetical protein [Hyphomonas sp.]|jgi:hypothetical protein|uniref:hypothetical protein n=1 Tax=Hyphomonas sp. TaxID=87 RepID=UPI0039E44B92